jgi:hypothetical protein
MIEAAFIAAVFLMGIAIIAALYDAPPDEPEEADDPTETIEDRARKAESLHQLRPRSDL